MKIGIQAKIILVIVIASALAFSLFSYKMSYDHRQMLEDALVDKVSAIAFALDTLISTKADLDDSGSVLAKINHVIWTNPDVLAVSVFARNASTGELMLLSSSSQSKTHYAQDPGNKESYLENKQIVRFLPHGNSRFLRVTSPMHLSGQVVGSVQVDVSTESADDIMKKHTGDFVFFSMLTSVFLMLIIFISLSVLIIIRLKRLKHGLEKISSGDYAFRVSANSDDELGNLAGSFNKMAADLGNYHERLLRHGKELENTVNERTKELSNKVKQLQDARLAMLNMLEDANSSRTGLEKTRKELLRLNKEMTKANVELKKSEEYKNQFISITAHELKTPLASIHGFAGLLQNKKIFSNPKQRDYYLEIIQQDSERLKKLIDDILDLSRLDLGTMKFVFEEVDLKEVFKNTMKEMYVLASKNSLLLKMDVVSNVPLIITDKSRLSQILVNLVNNAIKYTPKKGGKIIVRAEIKGKKGDYVLFSVKDTGIGIPKSAFPKIFQRFYQVDSWLTRKVGGSGLGLSICKGIVEAMGGKIWFESKLNKGSAFYFTLPVKSKEIVVGQQELEVLKIKDKGAKAQKNPQKEPTDGEAEKEIKA